MKYGSAFLNGEGGILIAGIQDDGKERLINRFCPLKRHFDVGEGS